MDRLDRLEAESIYIIREAYKHFGKAGVLWSIGKDSTVVLWLIRKAFFGHVPFPVIHIDTTFKFPEMYAFRDRYAKEWDLDLVVGKNDEALKAGVSYDTHDALEVCELLKTVGLKQTVAKHGFDSLIVGIRGDEEGSRSKERIFSVRNEEFEWKYTEQAPEIWDQYMTDVRKGDHVRIHPILHWTELDTWRYIEREDIPVVPLYFSKDGKRYRSLGCMPITKPVASEAKDVKAIIKELEETRESERSGRDQDKGDRYSLQKLRSRGYM